MCDEPSYPSLLLHFTLGGVFFALGHLQALRATAAAFPDRAFPSIADSRRSLLILILWVHLPEWWRHSCISLRTSHCSALACILRNVVPFRA